MRKFGLRWTKRFRNATVWRRTFGIKESAAEAFLSGHPPQDAKKKTKKKGIRYWSWPLFLLLFGYGSDNAVIQSHA